MGFIADLLKRKSVPEEKVDSSLRMLDMLKEKRGDELGKYLDLMIDPRKAPPPSAPSTIEDLDEREAMPSSVYSPPMETVVNQSGAFKTAEATLVEADDTAIEIGINNFFDIFAGQASAHNSSTNDEKLTVGIRRPWKSSESYPDGAAGQPVLNACLHTADWGIFFFAFGNTIELYLLPYHAETSVQLKDLKRDNCHPLLQVTTTMGIAGREWYVRGQRLVRDRLPELSSELLGDLLHAEST